MDKIDRKIDFEIPIRPFIKQNAKGLSGDKKFVLLVSYLSKGDPRKEIELEKVEGIWNTMKAMDLLGGKFNRAYSNRAKDNDWVDAKKTGTYILRPTWKEIFK